MSIDRGQMIAATAHIIDELVARRHAVGSLGELLANASSQARGNRPPGWTPTCRK